MKTVAIIPARYGSERLPAKPLADIAGIAYRVDGQLTRTAPRTTAAR